MTNEPLAQTRPQPDTSTLAALAGAAVLILAAALAAVAAPAGATGDGGPTGDAEPKQGNVIELDVEAHDGGGDFWFTFQRADGRNPTVALPAGAHVVVNVVNRGNVLHNFHVQDEVAQNCTAEPALSPGACATALLNPGQTATLEFDVPEDAPDTFLYWCDPHRGQGMVGEFQVTEAAQPAGPPGANVTGPNITIVQPEENATVPLNDTTATVTVEVNVSNFNLSDAFREGAPVENGTGHIHFWLQPQNETVNATCFNLADGAGNLTEAAANNASAIAPGPVVGNASAPELLNGTGMWVNWPNETLNITDVPSGAYVVCTELVNNDHTGLSPPVIDTVNITVGEGAEAAQPPADEAEADDQATEAEGDAGSPYVG